MNKYVFKWKRVKSFFWQNRTVAGHRFDADQNKMVLYMPNGSIEEIADWKQCSAKLGTDWVLATKEQMEREANTAVKLNVDTNSKGA